MKEDTDLARAREAAFRAGLAAEGFVDGSNYLLLARFLEGDFNRVEPIVRELGLLKPRVAAIAAMGISAFHQQYPETPSSSPALRLIRSRLAGFKAMLTRAACSPATL